MYNEEYTYKSVSEAMELFCVIARGEDDTIVSFKTLQRESVSEDFTCVICLSNGDGDATIQLEDTCSPLYKYASVIYSDRGDGSNANVKSLCSHVFHTECIYKWFDEQKRVVCPLCISEIPIEELYPLYVEKPKLVTTQWDNGNIKEKYYAFCGTGSRGGTGIGGEGGGEVKCGPYEYYLEAGQLLRQCNYNEIGLKDGLEIEYYPFSSKIRSHINWKDGELHGRFWVKNCKGWWQCKGMYKNGRLHGNLKKWHPKKRVLHIACTYVDGKKEGKSMEWFDNGQLRKYAVYNQNKVYGLYLEYHHNGTLKKRCFIENGDIFHGMFVEYFETGALKTKKYYSHGAPIHYSEKWHSNGTMASYQEYLLVRTDATNDAAGGGEEEMESKWNYHVVDTL
jgi:antitoxin component YwqK of YwqJK toxin-antitoxin module